MRLFESASFAILSPEWFHHKRSPSVQLAMIGPRASKCVLWCLPNMFGASSIVEGSADTVRCSCAVRLRWFRSDLVQQRQNFLFDAV